MANLQVRRPQFQFDETTPFQWQPANPHFGLFCNAFTFLAIAFERYLVSATRRATPRFTDPSVAEEAETFIRQEAQHAKAHRAHAKALIAQYPGLQSTLDDANAAYDELLERESTNFHLAYVADLEATFTPLFKMVLDNRSHLFSGGDERVGTLFLWHFVEEIEHRSSGLVIYNHFASDNWYRIRQAPKVFTHVAGIYRLVLAGMEEHVPLDVRGLSIDSIAPRALFLGEVTGRLPMPTRRATRRSMLADVPGSNLRTMVRRLAASQSPRHDPADQPLPEWAEEWHRAFDSGDDITTYSGARL